MPMQRKRSTVKLSGIPNFWEVAMLVSKTMGKGFKSVYEKQKDRYKQGYLPLLGEKSAESILNDMLERDDSALFLEDYCKLIDSLTSATDDVVREKVVNHVAAFIGENFREKCAQCYSKLFAGTLFTDADFESLMDRPYDGSLEYKKLAYAIPFSKSPQRKIWFKEVVRQCGIAEGMRKGENFRVEMFRNPFFELGSHFGFSLNKPLSKNERLLARNKPLTREQFLNHDVVQNLVNVIENKGLDSVADKIKKRSMPDLSIDYLKENVAKEGFLERCSDMFQKLQQAIPAGDIHVPKDELEAKIQTMEDNPENIFESFSNDESLGIVAAPILKQFLQNNSTDQLISMANMFLNIASKDSPRQDVPRIILDGKKK